jgi:hypothetical protein
MVMRDRPYDEVMAERYREDPLYAISMFWELLTNDGQRASSGDSLLIFQNRYSIH